MGFFSFETKDTGESIANKFSSHPTFPVFMRDMDGNVWTENDYEGYGVFGGKDFYELLAEMNGHKGTPDQLRSVGLDLAFNEYKETLVCPSLNTSKDIECTGEFMTDCPYQGFFYED